MKKKKIFGLTLVIVLIIVSVSIPSSIKTTHGYVVDDHKLFISKTGALFTNILDINNDGNLDDLDINHQDFTYFHEKLNEFYTELRVDLRPDGENKYTLNHNLLRVSQEWSDRFGELAGIPVPYRSWNHFWDPIDLEPLVLAPNGGAIYVETYFNLATDFYKAYLDPCVLPPQIDPDFDPQFSNGSGTLKEFFDTYDPWDVHLNNYEKAYFCLGVALHVIQDVTIPIHAVNTIEEAKVNLNTILTEIQEHVNIEVELYEEFSEYNVAADAFGDFRFREDWNGNYNVRGWVHEAAQFGRERYDIICDYNHEIYSEETWESTSKELFDYAVEITGAFIFHFWLLVNNVDVDEDGLTIPLEKIYYTHPYDADSDNDNFGDGEEIYYWEESQQDPLADYDNDGLTNLWDADSDNDGLLDGDEFKIHGTNPGNPDCDDDGLNDLYEVVFNTDPYDPDCDNDGLNDYVEVIVECTDPWDVDTDNDGYTDYEEVVIYGTNPLFASDNPSIWHPDPVQSFYGHSNLITGITFTWNEPTNYQSGWVYKLFVNKNGNYIKIYEGNNRNYYFNNLAQYGLSLTTAYTYRITCFNVDDSPGAYSYWTGRVKSGGGWM